MAYLEVLHADARRTPLLDYRPKMALCTRDSLEYLQANIFNRRYDDTVARVDFASANLKLAHKYRIKEQVKGLLERPIEFRHYLAYHLVYPGRSKCFHALLFQPYVDSLKLTLRDRDEDYVLEGKVASLLGKYEKQREARARLAGG